MEKTVNHCECHPRCSVDAIMAAGILEKIKRLMAKEVGDYLELSDCGFCTDKEGVSYTIPKGGNYLQDFSADTNVAALIDAYNVLVHGKPIHCTPMR